MSDTVHTRIKLKRDTCANWNAAVEFIPLQGELIIYTDYQIRYLLDKGKYVLDSEGKPIPDLDSEGNIKYIPGIKIGDEKTYVQDLPFVDDDTRAIILTHLEDYNMHLRFGERPFWDHKIDVMDDDRFEPKDSEGQGTLTDETLILTRDDWKNFKKLI